ncbi:MAG: class I SAM-dependent methyltransferase [Cyanobacteriota bacterium]
MQNLIARYGWNDGIPHTQSYVGTEICKFIQTKKPASICDIGCGNGALLKSISELGNFELYGIEADSEGSKIASAQCPGAKIINISTESDPPAELSNIELVVSTEVIEHLFRPASLLNFAQKILAPSGRIIISTPYHGYIKNLAISLSNSWDQHCTVNWGRVPLRGVKPEVRMP